MLSVLLMLYRGQEHSIRIYVVIVVVVFVLTVGGDSGGGGNEIFSSHNFRSHPVLLMLINVTISPAASTPILTNMETSCFIIS